jgi:hypothetical protein
VTEPIVAAIRTQLAWARAGARQRYGAARERFDAARERREAIARAAGQVPSRAALAREEKVRELDRRYAAGVADLVRQAVAAAGAEAPGAAGSDWSGWTPTPLPRGQVAGPIRVGRLDVPGGTPVPALVPLLDRAHVVVTGDQPGDVIAALLLRTLGSAPAGQVRLTGYDPEHLGGALAGFAPLATAGLLTFVGPGGLGDVLDDLVDQVRRINESVLAGEYPSLRALAEATGRRPEPWRVAVLLGAGREGELSRHEQAQLERLLRTGVACGVHLVAHALPIPRMSTVDSVDSGKYKGIRLIPEPPPADRPVRSPRPSRT